MGREDGLKDYIEVNQRIMKFYEKYPNGRIITEIVSWENKTVVMRATAYRNSDDIIGATGHAYEKEDSTFINKTSALENCETSCVGRALALLGFEIKKSIASKEEVANAMHQQEMDKPKKRNTDNQNKPQLITEAQAKRLYALGKGKDTGVIKELLKVYGFDSAKEITFDKYNEICSAIEQL